MSMFCNHLYVLWAYFEIVKLTWLQSIDSAITIVTVSAKTLHVSVQILAYFSMFEIS